MRGKGRIGGRLFWALFCRLSVPGGGCGSPDMKKLRDVEFTVVAEQDIPPELAEAIEERKAEEFQFIYQSGEDLYIAKGYGRQETSGYSIQAKELYLTKDCLVFDTELTGPGKGRRCRDRHIPVCSGKNGIYGKKCYLPVNGRFLTKS